MSMESLDLATVTGEQVKTIREAYRLSRAELAKLCGIASDSSVRTAETKDGWPTKRASDQTTAQLLCEGINTKLLPSAPVGRRKGETGDERVERLMSALSGRQGREEDTLPLDTADPVATEPVEEVRDLVMASIIEDVDTWAEPVEGQPSFTYGALPASSAIGAFLQSMDAIAGIVPDDLGEMQPVEFQQEQPWAPPEPQPGQQTLKMLSNSEVADWNRCRRRWYLRWYRKLLNRPGTSDYTSARAIGTRIHAALAAWYVPDGVDRKDPRQAIQEEINADWERMAANLDPDTYQEAWDKFSKDTELERIMIEGYMQWIEETGQDTDLVIIQSEQALEATLTAMIDGEAIPFKLIGLIDVRAFDKRNGARFFLDHKSLADIKTPIHTLRMNPQMLSYMLLEWLNSSPEERTATALYNMLRKVKRTAQAKPPFYDRHPIHHNVNEINSYMLRVTGAATDIIRTERALASGTDHRVVAYPTPLEKSCHWDCDFFGICPMFDDGSRVEEAIEDLYVVGDPLARYDGKVGADLS
jgi:transcriptional regulator with XRE-family HTH domain/RecB family exonuclease